MLNKTMIALSATLVLGAASSAFAYDAPEHKIGDRYPLLEQTYRPVMAQVGNRHIIASPTASLNLYASEVPEHKISDRYPWLEAPVKVANVKVTATVKAMRFAKSFTLAEKSLFDRQSARVVF